MDNHARDFLPVSGYLSLPLRVSGVQVNLCHIRESWKDVIFWYHLRSPSTSPLSPIRPNTIIHWQQQAQDTWINQVFCLRINDGWLLLSSLASKFHQASCFPAINLTWQPRHSTVNFLPCVQQLITLQWMMTSTSETDENKPHCTLKVNLNVLWSSSTLTM